MANILEGQRLLQRAYDLSIGKISDPLLRLPDELLAVGIMSVHVAYYDGGLAVQEDIREELRRNPNGPFACLIRSLRNYRVAAGEYSEEILDSMYGLTERL